MYLGTNPSALRSREWITQALLALLEHERYDRITVKDICKRAGLSRQTFYQMFDSKDEVMEYHFGVLFSDFQKQGGGFEGLSLTELTCGFFSFFKAHRDFIEILIQNNMSYLLEREFERYLPQIDLFRRIHETEEYPDYLVSYVAGALCQILIHWYEKDLDISVEKIGSITEGIIRGKLL